MSASDDTERRGLAPAGRPEEPQLTVRALVVGALLGALLALSNLYVALKTGWSLGLTVTAGVSAWAALRALRALGVAPRPFGLLENNTACSVASSAGFMAGGGNLAALPALLLLTGHVPSWGGLALWFALVAVLGIFLALPLKRRLIHVEALPFPTGTATAQTLRALHGEGAAEGSRSARRLALSAALAAAALAWLRESPSRFVPFRVPGSLPWAGPTAARYTIGLDVDLLFVGAGALLGMRTAVSLLVGSLAHYGLLAPQLVAHGEVAQVGYRALLGWSLWPAAGLLLGASLTGLLLDGKQVMRALAVANGAAFRRRHQGLGPDPREAGECPAWWTALAFVVLAPALAALMVVLFGLPWWSALVALPLSVLMALIAARATGETDVTPTQALGPAAEIACGSLVPQHAATAGLVGANLAAGVGLHAADLLTDLKAGYLLGARPRAQLVAQLVGAGVGAVVVAPAFHFVVRNPALLGTPELPAPSAMIWAAVARALEVGAQAIPQSARQAALAALLVGAVVTLLERLLGEARLRYLPSPTGLGVALLLPASSSAALFVGAALAWLARRRNPDRQNTVVIPVASGLIAGESLAALLGMG